MATRRKTVVVSRPSLLKALLAVLVLVHPLDKCAVVPITDHAIVFVFECVVCFVAAT